MHLIRSEQDRLKSEMDAAKSLLGCDPQRWSYELHVEESGMKGVDGDAFVEAFQRETHILRKRVDACKSHAQVVTCFDVEEGAQSLSCVASGVGCTTECDFAQDIVLEKADRTETELF